ncbi:DnaJ domain-containing protein [Pseudomonas amygdali pv. morsprunorum]|nr:DnaJ domain-containing protein [Pseudomonas amygdali pv. morsprunorum]
MNCWSILGLDAPSDIRSIKRRYAVLLKQNRPDEDPVNRPGFLGDPFV